MMKRLRISTYITVALGIVAFIMFILERLALLDIWQAIEPDLTLEWTIVRLSALPMLLFFVSSVVTGVLLRKQVSNRVDLS